MIFSKFIFKNFKFGQYLFTLTACHSLGLGTSRQTSQGGQRQATEMTLCCCKCWVKIVTRVLVGTQREHIILLVRGGWLEPRTIPPEGSSESTLMGDEREDVPGREDKETDAGGRGRGTPGRRASPSRRAAAGWLSAGTGHSGNRDPHSSDSATGPRRDWGWLIWSSC